MDVDSVASFRALSLHVWPRVGKSAHRAGNRDQTLIVANL
jgi:hypothetical protein